MNERAAIVGAGIAGLTSALALSRRGIDVTLFERDKPPPDGDAEQAFFEWQRRGAAQFRHPHAFLGLLCSTLERHYPDLLQEFFAAGARRVDFKDMIPPHLLGDYAPDPADDEMWMLMCRRATLETVLRRYVMRQAGIQINNSAYVTGVDTVGEAPLRVTGLEVTDRLNGNERTRHAFDLVIDATGRASKFPRWLGDAGARIEEQRDDAEIVYYTRHYKLRPGVEEPDRHKNDPAAGDVGYMKYGVFPGDGGHFALIICLPNGETELRAAVKDGARFDAICRQIPGLVPWIAADRATATTEPFGIGEIHAVWRDFVHDGVPEVLNFFAVGDSAVRTNPLYGRGCSTGVLHAHLLGEVLEETADPVERAKRFHEAGLERMRPIFDASLREDKNGLKKAEAVMLGLDRDRAESLKHWFGLAFGDALAAAVRDELHVFRGMMRTVNLVEKPGAFLSDPKIKRTIFRYMLRGRRRNAKARIQRGPSRAEMLAFLTDLETEPQAGASAG